jgi:uncharacterized protein
MRTTTAAAPPVSPPAPPAAPPRAPRRPDRGRRRRTLQVLAAAAVLGVVAVLAGTPGERPHDMAMATTGSDLAGTYRLDDGALLTVWGGVHHPAVEVDGRVTHLLGDGEDRYRTFDGAAVLRFSRGQGQVDHVRMEQEGAAVRSGIRVEAHREDEVTFRSGAVELAGTVFTPVEEGPHPAVVIVHGAEFTDRSTYRLLASHLARNGVTVLIYDKRGTGASSGSARDATFDDLTDDALAGISMVASRSDVRDDRVGVLGFSQGAWVAAKAAKRSGDIDFVIAYSPSGFSPADQQAWLHGSMLAARGFDRAAMRIADRVDRMLYSSVDLVDAGIIPPMPHVPGFWFHALDLHLDTAALWEGVRQPVLLAWGELDCQVPAEASRAVLTAALQRGGNTDVTTAVFPGADHSFMLVAPCGHETGLADHSGHTLADGYLQLAPTWIQQIDADAPSTPMPHAARTRDAGVLDWHLDAPNRAPWYGSIGVQLATVVVLIALFVTIGRAGRSPRRTAARRALMATGAAGVAATVTVLSAFTEIAMLGATHAAFLIGGPTVESSSFLMGAARVAVSLTGITALSAGAFALRGRQRGAARDVVLLGGSTVLLLAWAAYWGLTPLV